MVVKYHDQPAAAETSSFKIFRGRVVHSTSLKHLEIIDNATLGVRPDGTIAFLRKDVDSPDGLISEDLPEEFRNVEPCFLKPSEFLFPGMIDTHLHAPQWPNLALGMEGDLREWCENWTDPIEVTGDCLYWFSSLG